MKKNYKNETNLYYRTEMETFLQNGCLSRLTICESKKDDSQFKYVQDALKHYSEDLIKIWANDIDEWANVRYKF
jgi:sulfite reductase alpha subunit-like flavoprotein